MLKDHNWQKYIDERLKDGTTNLHADMIKKMDHALLAYVSRRTNGDVRLMARALGISVEDLERKIRDLGPIR